MCVRNWTYIFFKSLNDSKRVMSECLGLHHALFLELITWRYGIMPSGYCNFHIYPYMLNDTELYTDNTGDVFSMFKMISITFSL